VFVDPDLEQVKASHRADAEAVELHTGRYCEARSPRGPLAELARIVEAAKARPSWACASPRGTGSITGTCSGGEIARSPS